MKSAGTYTWSPSWTWKSTVDSYRVVAYYKSGSSYIKSDEARGFVQADKITQNVGGWTPNMYTRATKSALGTDYSIFNFKFWYWDNSVYNPDQGTSRLDLLKSRTGEVPGFKGSFVTEFRRAQNGYDAAYWNGVACIIYAWNGNLPNPQREVEENDCFGGNEEFEVFTYDDELMTVVTGSDPTNVDTNSGYFSEVTMFKRSPGTTVNLTMEYELEECTFCGDSFDIVDATKQTEVV